MVGASMEVPRPDQNNNGDYGEEFFAQHAKVAGVYPLLAKHIEAAIHFGNSQGNSNGAQQQRQSQQQTPTISSMVDVGCGHGLLVEAFRNNGGIRESYGIEGSFSAKHMWPPEHAAQYYQIQDLTATTTRTTKATATATATSDDTSFAMPKTDLVTTFEVAEHLPPQSAADFVGLLTQHAPKAVVFGAATMDQDQGRNPTHVNENTFAYWMEHFRRHGYVPDMTATARFRHLLLTDPAYAKNYAMSTWWYPKNTLIFVPLGNPGTPSQQRQLELDRSLDAFPPQANMRNAFYLTLFDTVELGPLWKRDWTEFANLFYLCQAESRARLLNHSNMHNNAAGTSTNSRSNNNARETYVDYGS